MNRLIKLLALAVLASFAVGSTVGCGEKEEDKAPTFNELDENLKDAVVPPAMTEDEAPTGPKAKGKSL